MTNRLPFLPRSTIRTQVSKTQPLRRLVHWSIPWRCPSCSQWLQTPGQQWRKESLGRNDRDRYLLTSSKAQTTRMKTFLTRRQLNRLSPGSSHFVASSITAGMKSMTVVMLTAEKRPRRGIIRGMAIASRVVAKTPPRRNSISQLHWFSLEIFLAIIGHSINTGT